MRAIFICLFFHIYAITLSGQDAITFRNYSILDVGKISIPSTLEIQSGEIKKLCDSLANAWNSEFSNDFLIPVSKAVFQQAGLNNNVKSSFNTYARIIISITNSGAVGNSHDIKNASLEEMTEIDSILKDQFELQMNNKNGFNSKILDWFGTERVEMKGWTALRFSYSRVLNENPPVLVTVYRFYSNDKIFSVTLSYRMQDEILWKNSFDNIIKSFTLFSQP